MIGALFGIAGLVGAAMILIWLARRRRNPVGAFALGLVVVVAVFALLSAWVEASFGADVTGLVIGMAVVLAAGLAAAAPVMAMVFPAKDAAERTSARSPARSGARGSARAVHEAPRGPVADVFVSYKREERAQVQAIVRRLEALKLRVWFDAEVRAGETFDAEIDRQVRGAKAVLVCWSPAAVASDWVRGEATIGRERGVLAAVVLKACALPAPFNLVHAESVAGGVGPASAEWLRVVERVGQLVGRPGLAAYEALEATRDKGAYAAWMAQHAGDALFESAAARLKQL